MDVYIILCKIINVKDQNKDQRPNNGMSILLTIAITK
jgi:hypothetical protein